MSNPITNDVFDSRDLIEYKEELEQDLIDNYNTVVESINEDADKADFYELAEDIYDIENNLIDEFMDKYSSEWEYYERVVSFCNELDQGDFIGEDIISEDYFTDYCEEFVRESGYISDNLPHWIADNIDWDGVADELMQDYISANFEGTTYYMRG